MQKLTCALYVVALAVGCGDNGNTNPPNVDASPPDVPPDACIPTTTHATVTSGDIGIDETQRSVFAEMTPPLDRSVLVYGVRQAESSPRFGGVVCELVPEDTTIPRPAGMLCRHESSGTDTSPPVPITVHWQVITFDMGVKVQRGLVDTSTATPQTATLTAVNPAKTFVVLGGSFSGGGGWGNNDFTRMELKNATTLEIRHVATGAAVPWQVVELDDTIVQRGSTSLIATDTTKTVALTNLAPNSIVLATHTNDNPASIIAASMMLQASLSNSSLDLKRAMGGTAMDVSYEVIRLPFPAQQFTTDFAAGESVKTQAVTGIVPATSVAFSTMQATVGQSFGSTEFADPVMLDLLGEASFTFTISAGSVSVERSSSTAAASVTWNVVDFAKDVCD